MLKLIPSPTFKAKVPVYVPGADDPVLVEFEFKHKTRSVIRELQDRMTGQAKGKKGEMQDEELVLDLAQGWELEDKFDETSVKTLVENYPGVALQVWRTYVESIGQARAKN